MELPNFFWIPEALFTSVFSIVYHGAFDDTFALLIWIIRIGRSLTAPLSHTTGHPEHLPRRLGHYFDSLPLDWSSQRVSISVPAVSADPKGRVELNRRSAWGFRINQKMDMGVERRA
jgi:hypothetical protein